MRFRKILLAALLCVVVFGHASSASAQSQENQIPRDQYFRAEVLEVDDVVSDSGLEGPPTQHLKVRILDEPEEGKEVQVDVLGFAQDREYLRIKKGEKIVISKPQDVPGEKYVFINKYRLPSLIWLGVIFLALVVIFARWKGISSVAGLIVSILVLVYYVVPKIFEGSNPLLISFTGSLAILLISLYVAHGFNKRTSIALMSALATLVIALGLSILFVNLAKIFGVGTEDAAVLAVGFKSNIDVRGLFLGGVMIGVLGVLDDIAIGQTTAIQEIKKANAKLGFSELYRRGIRIGREHILSLVNTLVLAYAGVSLPLLLIFKNQLFQPMWVLFNSDIIAEEIVRTLVGSSALIFAIPITTALAAYFFSRKSKALAE